MISERTLKRWRRDALQELDKKITDMSAMAYTVVDKEKNERILRMTQELLDQHLVRK